ncbi:MAG: efflux RND transporter periplasmic adaptor subunit, partial [Chloroflexota bacterium]|nr:efflux RND transporter periplasmic adaptor subunit [Chloroflexota bacterium]
TARAGASPEQVRVAQAGVAQADAAVLSLLVMLDQSTLRAPIAGLVIARSVEEGEMAIPGASLLTLANLDEVRLTLYIAEDRIARVRLGQTVRVQVDSFAGRAFEGKVSYISPQAEFTPRAVQTQEERVKTVFAVRVTIANQDHALKLGMPADAVLGLGDEEGR